MLLSTSSTVLMQSFFFFFIFCFFHQKVVTVLNIIKYNRMDLNTILDQAQFIKSKAFVQPSPLEVPVVIYVMNMSVFF